MIIFESHLRMVPQCLHPPTLRRLAVPPPKKKPRFETIELRADKHRTTPTCEWNGHQRLGLGITTTMNAYHSAGSSHVGICAGCNAGGRMYLYIRCDKKKLAAGSTLMSNRAIFQPSADRDPVPLSPEVGRVPVHSTRYGS